jgi:uncharacterized small protein (DUF1192 family)
MAAILRARGCRIRGNQKALPLRRKGLDSAYAWRKKARTIPSGQTPCGRAGAFVPGMLRLQKSRRKLRELAQDNTLRQKCQMRPIIDVVRLRRWRKRMAIEDDDKPRKKVTHEIGQDLSLLSVEELTERIALMNSEIERLQVAMSKKQASKDAANSFFKS